MATNNTSIVEPTIKRRLEAGAISPLFAFDSHLLLPRDAFREGRKHLQEGSIVVKYLYTFLGSLEHHIIAQATMHAD